MGGEKQVLRCQYFQDVQNVIFVIVLDNFRIKQGGVPFRLLQKMASLTWGEQRYQHLGSSLIRLKERSAAQLVSSAELIITPLLYDLHWRPISSWIKCKIALICFHTVPGAASPYLSEHSVCVCVWERERQRQRETERESVCVWERQRQTDRDRECERETETERERQTETDRECERERTQTSKL